MTSDQRDFVMSSSSGHTYSLCVGGVTDTTASVFRVFRLKFARPGAGGMDNSLHYCLFLGTSRG